eukprot:CAMPEP_0176229908 /NCGR_PEP_ID=MMETSP0121_2-20121125/24026_1 /TAXON_ID=160619 /ORGANISM="Kryptoperidinium foliaceum, Strain CCMP 1326" /LENGTH=190 /DNA_ID=CAMNT_0017569235 /DNA_START=20 /DNA_END=592 /DNA_ORIENTATION=-
MSFMMLMVRDTLFAGLSGPSDFKMMSVYGNGLPASIITGEPSLSLSEGCSDLYSQLLSSVRTSCTLYFFLIVTMVALVLYLASALRCFLWVVGIAAAADVAIALALLGITIMRATSSMPPGAVSECKDLADYMSSANAYLASTLVLNVLGLSLMVLGLAALACHYRKKMATDGYAKEVGSDDDSSDDETP